MGTEVPIAQHAPINAFPKKEGSLLFKDIAL